MKYGSTIEIGQRLREFRDSKNFTQKELGEKIGISDKFISAIETGSKSLSPTVLFKLEMIYNVNHNWLLYGIGTMLNEDGLIRRFQKSINRRVQLIRENAKMTKNEFAMVLDVTTDRVTEWEEQRMNLCIDDILNICSKFKVHPDWILYGIEGVVIY